MPQAKPKLMNSDWWDICRGMDGFHVAEDIAWIAKQHLRKGRRCGSCFVILGKIWVVGGVYENGHDADIEVYDPCSDSWLLKQNPFSATGQVFAATNDGKIFSFGGEPIGMQMPTIVEMYDTVTGSLTKMPDMPVGCWHPGVTVTEAGKIYLLGGYIAPATTIDTVQEYNTLTHAWTIRKSMPTKRYDFAAVTGSDGKIYAMGGIAHNRSEDLAALEVYNPITNFWTVREPMLTPRRSLAAVSAAGRIYAMGGLHSCASIGIVEEYDPVKNKWTAKAPLPTERWYLAATTFEERIYAIGGCRRTKKYLPENPSVAMLPVVEVGTLAHPS
jgi:N-acetylneuraminic acid mutarotase